MKKLLTLILTLVLALGACFSLTACGKTADLQPIKDAGKIVIGITDYEPMDYQDESGKWIGFDADLANMFAEELGVTCEFIEIDWDKKAVELNSRQFDLIWNGMTASEELGKQIDFSVSYAKNAQVAVVKSSSSLTKDDVATAKIAVEAGSAGNTVAKEFTGATLAEVGGQTNALLEVVAGTSEVAIIDITMAQSVVGKGEFAGLKILEGASYGDEIFAVGLRKNSDLKSVLDAFLKAKYEDGTMTTLAAKYSVFLNTEALSK